MGKKYLKNYLLLLLSLPIIGTTVAFCTNYLLNNKNTSNVNSSTTNSLDVITPTCSLGTCDANTLKLTGSTYDARNIINNEWVFENIKHLLSGNVNLIANSSDISEIETIIEPKNNLKNNNLTLKFIVAAGKTYDTNGLPTTSPTPFVVRINGFTPPSQTIAKASLTANDLGFNDQTVYDARSAIQNKGKTWVFENLNKLLDGNLDSTISVNDISDISVSKDNIGSNKRNDTLELSFFIKEGKTFDTNGYISNKKTLFKTTITNFSINPRTITNISCEASSLGFDSKTTYEVKKEINNSAEWIFNHKETIFNHDQKLLNKINVEDISNVNVEIKNSGNNIQNNSITINFNIAKDRTYDENGYLNTNSVPFSINVTNLK